MYYLSNVIALVLVIGVWSLSGRVDGGQIVNFILIGNLYFSLSSISYKWVIFRDISTGGLSSKLIRPTGIWPFYFAGATASGLRIILVNTVSLGFISVIFRDFLNWNWGWQWLWIMPFFLTTYAIKFCLDALIGLSSFWLTSAEGPIQIYEVSHTFLAGGVIPFLILGSNYRWLEYQPLAYTLLHPIRAIIGESNFRQSAFAWLLSLIWAIGLVYIVKLVFRLGLRRYESVNM